MKFSEIMKEARAKAPEAKDEMMKHALGMIDTAIKNIEQSEASEQ